MELTAMIEGQGSDLGVHELGEAPWWDARSRQVFWVDITPGRIHRWNPVTREAAVIDCGQSIGSAATRVGGGLVAALKEGLALVSPAGDLTWLAQFVPPTHRLNDGACDARGRYWVGATALEFGSAPGALYVVEPDGQVRTAIEEVAFSNGIGWSPDGETLYLIDSLQDVMWAFDFDVDTGEISGRRDHVTFRRTEGLADGLAVDAEGGVWVARYGAGAVERYDVDGNRTERHATAAQQPTCLAFGGEWLTDLYVTSARQFLPDPGAADGAVLRGRAHVAGVPAHMFAG